MILSLAAEPPAPVFAVRDPRITESSALLDTGRFLLTLNDSGHPGQVFVLDARTGRTVAVTDFGPRPVDTESMAPAGPGHVWVGDTGGNTVHRDHVAVYRVPFAGHDLSVPDAPRLTLTYPDGPHDVEAMVVGPEGRFYLITKGLFGGAVYAISRRPGLGENRLSKVGEVREMATDAALLPGGHTVLVRGYSSAGVYTFPGFRRLGGLSLPHQRQGEGVSVGPGGRIRLSSEGVDQPVLQLAPDVVRRLAERPTATPTPTPTSSPSRSAPSRGDDHPAVRPRFFHRGPLRALGGLIVLVVGLVAAWRSRRRRR